MLRFFHRYIAIIILFLAVPAGAQEVPYTHGFTDPVLPPIIDALFDANERNTCNPDFRDVMDARAWQEAQREITQNSNIIARPDSVLSVSCFDSWLDHLGEHADHNFPSDPDDAVSESVTGGLILEIALGVKEVVYLGSELINEEEAYAAEGYYLYAMLELLVLDQLVSDVVWVVGKAADDLLLLNCEKDYYLEDNFHDIMLGGRAIEEANSPVRSEISADFGDSRVSKNDNYSGCERMNNLWTRSKCYDFSTESTNDAHRIGAVAADGSVGADNMGGVEDHDGFYTLSQYEQNAASDDDYRKIKPVNNTTVGLGDSQTWGSQCPIPDDKAFYKHIIDNGTDTALFLACSVAEHNLTFPSGGFAALYSQLIALTADNPTWDDAYDDSNPLPGVDGGIDTYEHFLGLRDTTGTCADPVKLGYVVTNVIDNSGTKETITYIDAVCPTPGCWFMPPSNISSDGTCEK